MMQMKTNMLKKTESTPDNSSRLDAEVVAPLKNMSNFWRFTFD